MISVTRRSSCRACGSAAPRSVYRFAAMPLTDEFVARDRVGHEFLHDIEVFGCAACGVVQTQHDVDMTEYYADYEYSVGDSGSASNFMDTVARSVKQVCFADAQSLNVLEVGSGDGRQLEAFARLGCRVIGYEPSVSLSRLATERRGIPTITGLFDTRSIARIPRELLPLDIVFLSYTFDHLPEPAQFLADIRNVLKPESGVVVIEIHDLDLILQRKEYCLFEHEHTIYLNRETFSRLLNACGFEVVTFDLVPAELKRANSLLVAARYRPNLFRLGRESMRSADAHAREIDAVRLRMLEIDSAISRLDAFVSNIVAKGGRVAGYGAGGRGVMTLAGMKSASSVSYVVDKKPKLAGGFLPKSAVPLSEVTRLAQDPVSTVLVFSFGYMDEIQRALADLGYDKARVVSMLDVIEG
jgi:SAM-dependent methyltransferase